MFSAGVGRSNGPQREVCGPRPRSISSQPDGLGIIQVAEFVASHHLASGALIRVLPAWCCAALLLHLVTPTTRQRTTRVQAFMDWAQAVLSRRLSARGDAPRSF